MVDGTHVCILELEGCELDEFVGRANHSVLEHIACHVVDEHVASVRTLVVVYEGIVAIIAGEALVALACSYRVELKGATADAVVFCAVR